MVRQLSPENQITEGNNEYFEKIVAMP